LASVEAKVTEADLAPIIAKARKMLSGPVLVKYSDPARLLHEGPLVKRARDGWSIEPSTIAHFLRLEGGATGDVTVDKAKIRDFFAALAEEVKQDPKEGRFRLENGRLVPIAPSQDGQFLEMDALVSAVAAAINSDKRSVELPITVVKSKVPLENAEKLGIREKIEERSTYFGDSIPERAFNIKLAAERLNGTIVAPGEVFSFNDAIGEVSFEAGYALGFAIFGDMTQPDPGGGICQVVTTTFQSVFWAGYPIVERYPHAYRMRRYEPPPGLDATVYAPYADFKFKNNTDDYILIQAYTSEGRVYVALWGTRPNWTVTASEPVLENIHPADRTIIRQYTSALATGREVWAETAEDGVDITIKRWVREGDKERQDTFFSRYRPERNLLLIGTGEG